VAARWQRTQKKGSSPTGQTQDATAENRSGLFGHDFFFQFIFPPIKSFFPKKGERAADGIGFAPADLLYSESLTKSTKKVLI
jgi:hypothetical protein